MNDTCPQIHGPKLPTSADLIGHKMTGLSVYCGPFITRDGRRCLPSIPGVREAETR